ncbi:hypothetical protein [Devosia rhizoryzae]|uniref:Uncharacterized protein n=1 Tax=Devosia rhizoryzae TaxID=2774137 RepID=A0ABX7C3J4_9HYPH|nr:hypothetical protein [Devosia rhizoryzae]QQR38810.1 hypothetical protein JI748_13780 [Devosia rhizoryzae]
MTREIGTALAVLAIYVLTLLLPLHQAAAQQRDLEELGYSTLSSWSVCAQLAEDEQGDPRQAAALSCPALGIAKHQLDAAEPPAPVFAPVLATTPVSYSATAQFLKSTPPDHVGQSRAPPVSA